MVEQVSKQEIKQGGFREVGREDYRVSLRGHGGHSSAVFDCAFNSTLLSSQSSSTWLLLTSS